MGRALLYFALLSVLSGLTACTAARVYNAQRARARHVAPAEDTAAPRWRDEYNPGDK